MRLALRQLDIFSSIIHSIFFFPMTKLFRRPIASPLTRVEKLKEVLLDGFWHTTAELVRLVGHTFIVAKWVLVHRHNHVIEKRKHPVRRFQYEYRLLRPDDERNQRERPGFVDRVRTRTRSLAPVVL